MNIRRVQGMALIGAAVCLLLAFFGGDAAMAGTVGVFGLLLLIFGLPAVNSSQPTGSIGLIGVILIILAAVIALGFRVGVFGETGMADGLITTSVLSGLAGRVITGWLTTKEKVFSQWVGWALIASGGLNLPGLLGVDSPTIAIVIMLMEAIALVGYGIHIFQKNQSSVKAKVGLQ